jgi:hypothetical protein
MAGHCRKPAAHWAEKINFTIPRHSYENLLAHPTQQVRLLLKKELEKEQSWKKSKEDMNERIDERKAWIHCTKTIPRVPFEEQANRFNEKEIVNVFLDINLLSKELQRRILEVFSTAGYKAHFRHLDDAEEMRETWSAAKKWSCHVCETRMAGSILYCTICCTKKPQLNQTRYFRPDQFVGTVASLNSLLNGLAKLRKERLQPSKNAIGYNSNAEFLQKSHEIRFRSCDWFILEKYRQFSILPPRRSEVVEKKKRRLVDVERTGSLTAGCVLINRPNACSCVSNDTVKIDSIQPTQASQSISDLVTPKRKSNQSMLLCNYCCLCYQPQSVFVKVRRKYCPQMPIVDTLSKRPSSAYKIRRERRYKEALKLVPAARGSSHNPMITSPLRLACTRNPHWKYIREKKKVRNQRKKLIESHESTEENSGASAMDNADLIRFDKGLESDPREKEYARLHWWKIKKPALPTTETIQMVESAFQILGKETIVGSFEEKKKGCDVEGTDLIIGSDDAIAITRNKIKLVREIIQLQKEKILEKKKREQQKAHERHRRRLAGSQPRKY